MIFGDGTSLASWDFSPTVLYDLYTSNLLWNLFLTSTACHAIILIASPLQAVIKWYNRKTSDSDTPVPYMCGIIGSLLWLRYSIFIEDLKLILLQTYAVFMQTFFIIAMIYYRTRKRKLLRLVLLIIISTTILFLYIEKLSDEEGKMLIGRIASGAQIAGSLVCPYLIYRAIVSKVIDFVPLAPVAFTFCMEIHAIIYSIGIDDFYMLLANAVFCCMDGSLLLMFVIFPHEKPRKGKEINVPAVLLTRNQMNGSMTKMQ